MSQLSEEARDKKLYVLARSVQKGGMRLTYGDVSRAGDYEYIEYTLEYPLSASMFGYSSQHTYNGLAPSRLLLTSSLLILFPVIDACIITINAITTIIPLHIMDLHVTL